MITAALDDNLWVCQQYPNRSFVQGMEWADVLLDGAVYTTIHGPQPKSLGSTYYKMKASAWILTQNGKPIDFDFFNIRVI